jgi:hypothetical protein
LKWFDFDITPYSLLATDLSQGVPMSSETAAKTFSNEKTIYRNTSLRGRGFSLKVTVVVLLVAAATWIGVSTRVVAKAPVGASQAVDPGAINH